MEHYEEITQAVYEDALKFKYDIATEIDDGRIQMYFKQRNKDELITKEEVICNIRLASNGIGGINHWNTILLNRLDMTDYEEIINAVEEDGKELYQISEIIISEDKESFSLLLETNVYCVIKGDTLWQIAQRKRTTVDKLVELNQITYPDLIYPNKYLKIK